MQPRIYTYKITFEEVPYWYWGVHKEKKFGEKYLGSPVTHRWMWEFYTPKIQILEFFPYTDEGWEEANLIEKRLILPDLDNPFCLNENCGGYFSLALLREACKKRHEERLPDGRSVLGVYLANQSHKEKTEDGKSKHAVEMGKKGAEQTHKVKNEEGKSKNAVRLGNITMGPKNEEGKSVHAVRVGNITLSLGKGCHAPEHKGKGAKITNSQKWVDPNHTELGEHSAPTLAQMQKRRGYPHGKENRTKVG
jgi:hypothetical protein